MMGNAVLSAIKSDRPGLPANCCSIRVNDGILMEVTSVKFYDKIVTVLTRLRPGRGAPSRPDP